MKNLIEHHRGEVLCLLLLFATGVALLIGAATLPGPMFDPLGPAGLPRYIAYLLLGLLALRVVLLFQDGANDVDNSVEENTTADKSDMLGAGERGIPRAENVDTPQIAKLALASIITLTYVAALTAKVMPFTWLTLVFIAALGATMSDYTPRKLITVAIIAAVMSFALTYIFTDILSVVLPE